MTFGYTMLAVGALALLMMAVLNANRLIVNADVEPARSEQFINAVALVEGLFGEIRTKNFDENVIVGVVASSPTAFTASPGPDVSPVYEPFSLPDTGSFWSVVRYDDIDDYNGYMRIANSGSNTGFRISGEVYYVSESDFTTRSSSQTFVKRIVLTVVRPPDIDSISFSTIHAY